MTKQNGFIEAIMASPQPVTEGNISDLKPVIEAVVVNRCVKIIWQFDDSFTKCSMMEIIIDRDDDTRMQGRVMVNPKNKCYYDLFPHPANRSRWVYRAIFWSGIKRIGQWSPAVSVVIPSNDNPPKADPIQSHK